MKKKTYGKVSLKSKGKKKILRYKWEDVDTAFNLSIRINLGEEVIRINPNTDFQELEFKSEKKEEFQVDLGKSLIQTRKLN